MAIVTLALGIGATTAIFSVVNGNGSDGGAGSFVPQRVIGSTRIARRAGKQHVVSASESKPVTTRKGQSAAARNRSPEVVALASQTCRYRWVSPT